MILILISGKADKDGPGADTGSKSTDKALSVRCSQGKGPVYECDVVVDENRRNGNLRNLCPWFGI